MVVNIPDVSDELTEQILENAFEKAERDPVESKNIFWGYEPAGGFHRFVRCAYCLRVCCDSFASPNFSTLLGTCCNCAEASATLSSDSTRFFNLEVES